MSLFTGQKREKLYSDLEVRSDQKKNRQQCMAGDKMFKVRAAPFKKKNSSAIVIEGSHLD